jgi:hypothetical protein
VKIHASPAVFASRRVHLSPRAGAACRTESVELAHRTRPGRENRAGPVRQCARLQPACCGVLWRPSAQGTRTAVPLYYASRNRQRTAASRPEAVRQVFFWSGVAPSVYDRKSAFVTCWTAVQEFSAATSVRRLTHTQARAVVRNSTRADMLCGVLSEHKFSLGEIAKNRPPSPATPISRKIGAPECARINANASGDIFTLPTWRLDPAREVQGGAKPVL